jgi:hypothetical protein
MVFVDLSKLDPGDWMFNKIRKIQKPAMGDRRFSLPS